MSFDKPPPRKKNSLDDTKLRLRAAKLDGATGAPSLALVLFGHDKGTNPRFDVYTNLPNDRDNGLIRAPLDMPTLYMVLEAIEKLIGVKEDKTLSIPYLDFTWKDKQRSEKRVVTVNVIVGRDAEGIYLSVVAYNRPAIKFYFRPSDYHDLRDAEGKTLPSAFITEMYAAGWCKLVRGISPVVYNQEWREPVRKEFNKPGQQGGGGNYNNNGSGQRQSNYNNSNSGGGSRPAPATTESYDDDLPF